MNLAGTRQAFFPGIYCRRSFSSTMTTGNSKSSRGPGKLDIHNINQGVVRANYAVRGRLAIRADELRDQLNHGAKFPFKQVIYANIGNPQQLDQKPITFIRQVVALTQYPALLENSEVLKMFSGAAIERAKHLNNEIGSVGAYSHSKGVPCIRESVSEYITKRDGFYSDPEDIFLTGGASTGIADILTVICGHPKTGVMIPVPEYPLYTSTLDVLGATPVPYYLDEQEHWATHPKELGTVCQTAAALGIRCRALVVVNPCNPTGVTLKRSDMQDIIKACRKHDLVLMADEVYQTNVYSGSPFISFKKVLREMQQEHPGVYEDLQLVSFHSVSKGMIGECGQRGGYFELVGFDPAVVEEIYKLASIRLCPSVSGQVIVDCMVNPPKPGQDGYDQYREEYDTIHETLKSRAMTFYEAFKKMRGVECQKPQGAMYLFPSITIPPKAIRVAKQKHMHPDEFYCLEMLEHTGICVVPGSGFGEKDGTFHFRTTFLAPGDEAARDMVRFHEFFMQRYS